MNWLKAGGLGKLAHGGKCFLQAPASKLKYTSHSLCSSANILTQTRMCACSFYQGNTISNVKHQESSVTAPWMPLFCQRRYYKRKLTIKRPPTKVLNFSWGGDLSIDPLPLDPDKPRLEFEGAEDLERASDVVKKLVSVEFGDGKDRQDKRIHDLLDKVQEHPEDMKSLEVRVAYMTVVIRTRMKHVLSYRKDKRAKKQLNNMLLTRTRLLKELQLLDAEKYEWLCQELQLTYIPVPEYNQKISKRQQQRLDARLAAFAITKQKQADYKEEKAVELAEFLEYKDRELESIYEDMVSLGLDENSKIGRVYKALKAGQINLKEDNAIPEPKRRNAILEKKFEMYEQMRKEKEAAKL